MIITNLTWAQVNNAIEFFENNLIEFNEPMCTDRESGIYEIELPQYQEGLVDYVDANLKIQ